MTPRPIRPVFLLCALLLAACALPPLGDEAPGVARPDEGVIVETVLPGSAAAIEGLQPGDHIVSVDVGERTLRSIDDLVTVLEARHNQDRDALLLVYHDGQPRFVPLSLKTDTFGGLRFQ
jgi:S1-C subfamily serine protease